MITNVAFTIPGEPVGKGRPRATTINGMARLYTPKKTANYESLVALAAQQAMNGAPLFACACALEVEAVCGIPSSFTKKQRAAALSGAMRPTKKPDIDNVLKAVADGMNGVVWKDDVQAVDVRLLKRYGDTPAVHVRVAAIAPAGALL